MTTEAKNSALQMLQLLTSTMTIRMMTKVDK